MDSLTHLALGAAVGMAVMGRRTALWKAAAWGAVCNTLPDLDVFVRHGDPVLDMTLHRGHSHALLWLTLASPLLAWIIATAQRERALFMRWWLMAWIALVTHPLLDGFTVYGTQLLRPIDDTPRGLGSIFILDPLLTLPLLVGLALAARRPNGLRWNAAGLTLSALYLAWGVAVQQHVRALAERSLAAQGIASTRVLVTPAPLSSLLWRVVAMGEDGRHHEGFHSLFDAPGAIAFEAFDSGRPLREALAGNDRAQRIAAFSHGFYKLSERDGELAITDLRMGQEPAYTFEFVVARREANGVVAETPRLVGHRGDIGRGLQWLWRRMRGEAIASPR